MNELINATQDIFQLSDEITKNENALIGKCSKWKRVSFSIDIVIFASQL